MLWIDKESLGRFIDMCRGLNVDCGSIIWGNGALSPTIQYLTKNARRYLDVVAKLRGVYGRATDTLRSIRRYF